MTGQTYRDTILQLVRLIRGVIRVEFVFMDGKARPHQTNILSIQKHYPLFQIFCLCEPPATNKYNALKERLIIEFSDSENKQIRKLLSELQLGDDKPSHLLRKMRVLASGASLNDNFLKTLWLQRLPSEMQSILSVSSETLENLAKLADKIAEVRTDPFPNVSVMDKSTNSNPELPTNPLEDLPNPLYQEVVALRQQVDTLSQQFQRFSAGNPVIVHEREIIFHETRPDHWKEKGHPRYVIIIRNSVGMQRNVVLHVNMAKTRKTKTGYRSFGGKQTDSHTPKPPICI
ncbi:uncharacterized protein TNCV_3895551 [Trichonephila clavipes]|nr:uncharacterized protein TNCV_3895551 [Trichonephila clavipes]